MTDAEALVLIKGYASTNRVIFTSHARQRAYQRAGGHGGQAHVCYALAHATTCKGNEPESWKVSGPDLDGDEIVAVVAIEDGVIVVTIF